MLTFSEEHIDVELAEYLTEEEALEAAADAAVEAYLAEQEALDIAGDAAVEAFLAKEEALQAAADAALDAQLAEEEAFEAAADAEVEAYITELEAPDEAMEMCPGDTSDDGFDEFPGCAAHREWYEKLDPVLAEFASQFEIEEDFYEYMESRF